VFQINSGVVELMVQTLHQILF